MLPDEVLLDIFDFYLNKYPLFSRRDVEAWQQLLVRVCRRWRNLVLGSPRRLNCRHKTRARHTLDIWPALPIIVHGDRMTSSSGMDDIVATLEQSNRVCRVTLEVEGWQLGKVLPTMQVVFPELTDLYIRLYPYDETRFVLGRRLQGQTHTTRSDRDGGTGTASAQKPADIRCLLFTKA